MMNSSMSESGYELRAAVEPYIQQPCTIWLSAATLCDGTAIVGTTLASVLTGAGYTTCVIHAFSGMDFPARPHFKIVSAWHIFEDIKMTLAHARYFVAEHEEKFDVTILAIPLLWRSAIGTLIADVDCILTSVRLGRRAQNSDLQMMKALTPVQGKVLGVVGVRPEAIDALAACGSKPHFSEQEMPILRALRPKTTISRS